MDPQLMVVVEDKLSPCTYQRMAAYQRPHHGRHELKCVADLRFQATNT